ncbi:MAG: hypothetical protein ACOX4L_02365 [Bacillota bacterium]
MDTLSSRYFVGQLKEILNNPWEPQTQNYLRLDNVNEIDLTELKNDAVNLPPADPLNEAFNLIIRQIQSMLLENVLFGLNEIYKAYLRNIDKNNQCNLTCRLTDHLYLLFIFITKNSFPFLEQVWEIICSMSKPVGLFLIKNGFSQGASYFIEFLACIGKQAARHSLNTRTLQHVFRMLELTAQDHHWEEMKSQLQNLRQNLEN